MSLRGILLAFMASTSLVAAGVIPASYHVSKSHATASDATSTSGVEYYVGKVVDYLAHSASTSASPTGYHASAVPAVYSTPTQVAEYLTSSASPSTASDHATTKSDEHSTSTAPTETAGYLAAALHEYVATLPRPTFSFPSGDDVDGQAGVGEGGNARGWGSKRDEMTVDPGPSTEDQVEDFLILSTSPVTPNPHADHAMSGETVAEKTVNFLNFATDPSDPEQMASHGLMEDTMEAKTDEQDHATRDVKDEEIMDPFSAVTGKFLHHVAEEHNEHAEPADRHDKRREIPVEHVDAKEPAAPDHEWLVVDPVVDDVVSADTTPQDHDWLVVDPVVEDVVSADTTSQDHDWVVVDPVVEDVVSADTLPQDHDWLLVDPVVEDPASEEPASPDHPWLVIDPVLEDNVSEDAAPKPVKPAPKPGVPQIMSNVLAAVAKAPEILGNVKNMPGPVITAIDQPATTALPLSNEARAEPIIPTMMPDQPGEVETPVAVNAAPAEHRHLLPFPAVLPFSLQNIEENSVRNDDVTPNIGSCRGNTAECLVAAGLAHDLLDPLDDTESTLPIDAPSRDACDTHPRGCEMLSNRADDLHVPLDIPGPPHPSESALSSGSIHDHEPLEHVVPSTSEPFPEERSESLL